MKFTEAKLEKAVIELFEKEGYTYQSGEEIHKEISDGSTFDDHEIHRYLRKKDFANPDGEWFACRVQDVKAAILAIKNRTENIQDRIFDFKMRPEQENAVKKTEQYFKNFKKENKNENPRFLWNAKMRFGKTFASYKLAKKMGFKKILVLTFKPAVENAWEEDLMLHKDFEGIEILNDKSADTSQRLSIAKNVKTKSNKEIESRINNKSVILASEHKHSH